MTAAGESDTSAAFFVTGPLSSHETVLSTLHTIPHNILMQINLLKKNVFLHFIFSLKY